MADNFVLNVDSPQVQAPVSIDWGSGTFIDSIRVWIDETIEDIRHGGDEVITTLVLGLMFGAAVLHMWRKL